MSNRGHGRRNTNWVSDYPDLVAQWNSAKNGDLRAADLSYGSARKVWWQCPLGADHQWQASPNNRTAGRSGCPFCAGRAASVTNNLARLHPELAEQWHPTKNGDRKPEEVIAGSSRPVWWQCPAFRDHEWQATPHDRVAGKAGCPFCVGMRVAAGSSLAATAPEIAAEWHPTKNGRLTPREVTPATTRVLWWRCARNPAHEWRVSALKRTTSGGGCPECSAEDARLRQAVSGGREAGGYALCLDFDRDRRLALVLLLRSAGIDALGARDGVEARLNVKTSGEPSVIVTADERNDARETFPGVPYRVVPAGTLRAWLAAPGGGVESTPSILDDVAMFVNGRARRVRM